MLEIKSTDDLQSSRLNTIETLDKTQNERLNAIESVNATQTERLNEQTAAAIKVSGEQAARDSLQEKALEDAVATIRKEESERAAAEKTAQEEVDKNQTDAFNKFKEDQEKIDSAQNTAIRKAEEWQDENHDNKSLQTFIAEMVQKEFDDLKAANTRIGETESTLSDKITEREEVLQKQLDKTKDKLDKTAEELATTTAKATQLEGLLSLYAKKNSAAPEFLFKVNGIDKSSIDTVYVMNKNESVKVNFNVTDDPAWSAPAYSDLLVNGNVNHVTSYEDFITEDLTLQFKNTLTGKETPSRTVQFFTLAKPVTNPTQPSWVTDTTGDKLTWFGNNNLYNLTASADSQNKAYRAETTKRRLQYSTDGGSSWTGFDQGDKLDKIFGTNIQGANLRVLWEATDEVGLTDSASIDLGILQRSQAEKSYTAYEINPAFTIKIKDPAFEFTQDFTISSNISANENYNNLFNIGSVNVTFTDSSANTVTEAISIFENSVIVEGKTYTYDANNSNSTKRVYANTEYLTTDATPIATTRTLTFNINSTQKKRFYDVQ